MRKDCVEGDTLGKVSGRGPKAISSAALSPFHLLLAILSGSPPSARCSAVWLGWKGTGIAASAHIFMRWSPLDQQKVPAKVPKSCSNIAAFLARWWAEKSNININAHHKLRAQRSCVTGNETDFQTNISREETLWQDKSSSCEAFDDGFCLSKQGINRPTSTISDNSGELLPLRQWKHTGSFWNRSVQSSIIGWNVVYSSQIFMFRLKIPLRAPALFQLYEVFECLKFGHF